MINKTVNTPPLIMETPQYNEMQTIKRRLFAMRNGIIADTLRQAGSPFRIIFGLNLPQIVEIATETGKNRELADKLWANTTTRESLLIAPMLVEPSDFSIDDARRWVAEVPATEVADILCHRLLRHTPYAWELAEELIDKHDENFALYTGLRLTFNLVHTDPNRALALAERAGNHPLALALIDEAKFLLG